MDTYYSIHFQSSSVTCTDGEDILTMPTTVFQLDESCSLVCLPWPRNIPVPTSTFQTTPYYKVCTPKGKVNQPRKTVCYGESYTYSGLKHPVESTTPSDIQAIMDVTKELYENTTHKCMCLANYYATGQHSISAHSDDEKQFSEIRDVICWVIGGENRRIIFRNKSTKKIVINLSLWNCVYIMRGANFQKTYTHEIPKEKATLFARISACAPNLTSLEKADWLAENPEVVSREYPRDVNAYREWVQPRVSYTIRFFK